jgi:alkanesulfonate monooxygenase SsuD/methylene tetrahydromethanopterin reductase-like flavin-dependent oxidoreductase (luciferase family)
MGRDPYPTQRYVGSAFFAELSVAGFTDAKRSAGVGLAYQRTHHQLAETLCVPAPLSRPRPPILVRRRGERKTLLLVARYADACNLFASNPEEVDGKLRVRRSHFEAEGRDYDAIRTTIVYWGTVVDGDSDEFVADAQRYAALGVSQLDLMPDRDPGEHTECVAEFLPRIADL